MASNTIKINAVLVLGGAFNPIHTQHIEIMNIAKKYLEDEHNFNILEGLLAPAPNGYVKNKMKGDLVITDEHRINICNLAILNNPWIKETKKCYGSALACGKEYKGYKKSNPDLEIVVVVGADRATNKSEAPKWRIQHKFDHFTVFVGRSGETERVKGLWESDLKNGKISNPGRFYFVNIETEDVSSTVIRKELKILMNYEANEKKAMIEELIKKNYLNRNVAEYILKYEEILSINNKYNF